MNETYVKEYKKVLKGFAKLIVENPEIVDSLRESIKASARLMTSNKPETVSDFRKLAEEIDYFLLACKNGEIDPKAFVEQNDAQLH